ncbi:MAG: acetyl-CoA carboxylase carboxyl transferase subunit alpha, partial [Opitutales bacterium]|nr:acetyl-CoA carboxylase carboxyl transferase subunit alpha [Opitutales bacterium]
VLILENAYYSVISPESCSAILWKDRSQASQAAEALKLGDKNMLMRFGVVEEVIEEPMGGAQNDPKATALFVEKAIKSHLSQLLKLSTDALLEKRYERYRSIGDYNDGKVIDLNTAAS